MSLVWKSQFASQDRGCTDMLHWANSQAGQFEVFETGDHYLLHFPRQLSQPSELFDSLGGAKSRAEEASHHSSKGMTEKTIWVCDGCGEERDVTRNKQGDWHVVRLTSEGFNGYPTCAPEPTQTARHNLCPKCTTRLYRAINPRLWPSPDAKDQTL